MDAPRLGDIQVTLSDKYIHDLSSLGEFVDRIEMHKSHHQARILSSERAISVSLTQHGTSTCFTLRSLTKPLSEQLFVMSCILSDFPAFLLNVDDLCISATQASESTQEGSFYGERWKELLNSFTGVKWLHLDVNDLTSSKILRASQDISWLPQTTVRPVLYKLYLPHLGPRHVPLSEAVVSFMTSRWRSGNPIGVEYVRLRVSELHGRGPFSEAVTIGHEILPDDILLNIFRQYMDATPRLWPILTHVCRRWRQVILRSPLGLQLRLYCTYRTPASKTLDSWPPLPLVVIDGGHSMLKPPAPRDNDNIICALKHSDRVKSISLTLTNSLLKKLSTISESFSELEELVLLSKDKLQLTLPGSFRWGERVRTLHVTRIAISSLAPILSSSTDLVDLQLHEIPMAGYFSPQEFANVLSGASRLRLLSLHFLSFPPRRNYVSLPPPGSHRIVLPALTSFKYRGTSKYLDNFVARIDAPRLRYIDITFYGQPTMDASQFGKFIERIGINTALREADIRASAHVVCISLNDSSASTRLRLQIPCRQLDWQLSSMAQACEQFSSVVFGIRHLVFITNDWSSGQENVNDEQWLQLVRSFSSSRILSIAGELATDLLCALRLANWGYTTDSAVLPALRTISILKPMPLDCPFWDAAQSLISLRRSSNFPIEVQFECPDCNNTCDTSQGLRDHLVVRHRYEDVCSYCGYFQFILEYIYGFQEHLKREHPEAAQNDKLVMQFALSPLERDTLAYRHSSLRKPQIVAPSTAPGSR